MAKVYVVVDNGVYHGEQPFCSYSVFSTREKAKKFFDNYVAQTKLEDEANGYDMVEESEGHYASWRDGFFSEDFIEINLEEVEVDKNAEGEK